MVPILNKIGTDVACLGNHDLDFGVDQLKNLARQCNFPWLVANVDDPALGEGVSIGDLPKTVMLESSNGLKVGVIGLVEREWLDTITSLPPNLKYTNSSDAARALVPSLRDAGADIIIAVSHQREPNDIKLANDIPAGLIDIILGGHDHHYAHEIINGCHVIRSGCDFKQLSYIEARKKSKDGSEPGWNFDIVRRDITKEVPEDQPTAEIVDELTSSLKAKLSKPIGFTAVDLDAQFSTIRASESNMANFVCDVIRSYYSTDCSLMAAGTMRGDQIYPRGVLKLGDITKCFPFEDPVVVIRIPGASIKKALENGVSKLPAFEGRFPHVSNIFYVYDSSLPAGNRIVSCKINGEDLVPDKKYTMATRNYMVAGRDGYEALTLEHGGAECLVDDENGVLISTIIRQYFLSLKAAGKWRNMGTFKELKSSQAERGELADAAGADGDHTTHSNLTEKSASLAKSFGYKWASAAKLEGIVDWTHSISPKLEERMKDIKSKEMDK